jgi:hypothetical protein
MTMRGRNLFALPVPLAAFAVLAAGIGAAIAVACSTSSSSVADAGSLDGACGPLPESISVAALDDCVATVPNPCCTGFNAFACAAGDGGGAQCSETATCVRAARYDTPLCNGAQAYSCPDLNGANYATMTTPLCEQMEGVGPAGEGIRWCCGANLPPVTTIDAAAPPADTDSAAPPVDATTPPHDATAPPADSAPPPIDASPGIDSATDDAGTD